MPKWALVVVDSDVRISSYIRTIVDDGHREIITCDTGEHALEYLRASSPPKVVLLSSQLPDTDCVTLIWKIRRLNPHIKIAVMSRTDRYGDVVAAVRAGAQHILPKPFIPADLLRLVSELAADPSNDGQLAGVELRISNQMCMVYASAAMHEIQRQAMLVSRVNLPVLILGESGTGKEVVARYIHSQSKQAKNTFLKVNCAAVPSELLESELFGYEPGAFTGAGRSKPGKFKLCDGGTMFLDEIGEMHPSLQAKLLQVLQDGTFSPLGSRITEKVNVRIIAATNIDMKLAIANRTFREDLYYRLNGFCVQLPPLRERREDVPLLLRYFLHRYSEELGLHDLEPSFSARLSKACLRYDWPGNLRELESFVKRYLVLGDEQQMIDELTREINEKPTSPEVNPEAIQQALRLSGGNRKLAAKALGISYKVLLHRLRQFGLEPVVQNAWVV
ncbi:MAG TPA: sigma-54 dependent transcriptional regulator [Candidatus Eisenbacteria bacterium]|nr:sigma-54 dependent transcriptional regulator [Candidatus Eisenbacteria bacterium]